MYELDSGQTTEMEHIGQILPRVLSELEEIYGPNGPLEPHIRQRGTRCAHKQIIGQIRAN